MRNQRIPMSSVTLLIAIALLLGGCALYESEYPLEPVEKGIIDYRLVGKWECLAFPDADEPGMIVIKPLEGGAPYMRVAIEGANGEILGFTASLDGEMLFSGTDEFKKWAILHYWFVNDNMFELRALGDKTLPEEKQVPREQLLEIVRRRFYDETLYEETCLACWRDTSISYPGWLEDMMEVK